MLKDKEGPIRIGSTTIYPLRDKCIIPGCDEDAVSWWPLLPDGPAFCSGHYHRAVEYGADLSGPMTLISQWNN